MDSESEDEVEQIEEKIQIKEVAVNIEEKIQPTPDTKPAFAGLPLDDASDAWMNDDDVGIIDSESDDEEKNNKDEDKEIGEAALKIDVKIQEIQIDTKSTIAGLPMDDASDAWMNDDVGTIDSDSEDEVEQIKETCVQIEEKIQIKEVAVNIEEKIQPTPDTKPAFAGLPLDDASDAWMNDDDVGIIDSESDDEEENNKDEVKEIKEAAVKIDVKIQEIQIDTKSTIAGLPMDDASDAWMNDDVGTIDSDSEDEIEQIKETCVQTEEKIQEPLENTKPTSAGLPMDDASEAWMNDDFGTMDSDDEDSLQSIDKEKKIIVEKIEEFKEKLTIKSAHSDFAGLPVDDVSDTWMNDDFVAIEGDEDSIDEVPATTENSFMVTNCTCYSPLCSLLPSNNCYSPTCNRLTLSEHQLKDVKCDSISDYDENDKETQMFTDATHFTEEKVKEGRLSAIDEAKRFSCDDDEDNQLTAFAEVVKEVNICDDDESTSWAFVASKEPTKVEEHPCDAPRNRSSSSNPALIVEIIEKEQRLESMDPDGYKVVKGKTKTREKRKSKEITETSIEAIINKLDQPIETKTNSLQSEEMSSAWMDDFEIVDIKAEKVTSNNTEQIHLKQTEKDIDSSTPTENVNVNYDDSDDPWLAVKKEYTRKDSSQSVPNKDADDTGYTIEVKVTTKETCLGRRLHEQQEADWKMDVSCTQKNTIPDIIEGHEGQQISNNSNRTVLKANIESKVSEKKFNSLPRLKTKADSPETLCLSPAWMRKDLSRTQSVESNIGSEGGIFGSIKERKFSDSRTSCFTSSAETLDDNEDDVYWRLKHKVKKKKRRNQSGPSDAKSRSNNDLLFSNTKDTVEPLNTTVEPIVETKEESVRTEIVSSQTLISTSSINTIQEVESETIDIIDASSTKTSTAHTSIEGPNRKISISQKVIPNEKLVNMEMDLLRKESISPMQIDKEKSISVPLESVAESNMSHDFSENIKFIKTSVVNEEMHLANAPKIDIKRDETKSMVPPAIVLENETESKMAGATEIIRASSPRLDQTRPQFKRQNSKEMQQAVEVQRPLSFERQKTLSVSVATDKLSDEEGFEQYGIKPEKHQKKKSQNLTNKIDLEVIKVDKKPEIRRLGVDKEEENNVQNSTKNNEQRNSYAGLPIDNVTDAWMNDDLGSLDSEEEEENKPLALTAPSWAGIASKAGVSGSSDPELPLPSEIVPLKPAKPETLVIEAEGEEILFDEMEVDKEGFETVTSRKIKRERKNSKRISVSVDEESKEIDNVIDTDIVKYDMKAIEDAETKYFESMETKKENKKVEAQESSSNAARQPLALPAPSWSGIASKPVALVSSEPELPSPAEVVIVRPSKAETLIVEAEGEKKGQDDVQIDEEGFEASESRKMKKEKRISKRISVSVDEESEDHAINGMKAIENHWDKPLGLPAPSWAGIASKSALSGSEDPDLPLPPQVVSMKPSRSETLIIEAEGETETADEEDVDEEGFQLPISRKVKRERKSSKRISLCMDEEQEDSNGSIETSNTQIDIKTENMGLSTKGNSLIMNLSMDSFWICKHIFDDAEEKYYSNKKVDTIPIKEITDHNKKDDEDTDDDDDKDNDKEKENKDNKRAKASESTKSNDEIQITDYNWTDESTYLSPSIPVLKPKPLNIFAPRDSVQIESHLSKNARSLSNIIKKHMDDQQNTDNSEAGEHILGLSSQQSDDNLKNTLKVDMDNLQKAVANIDDTLQQLTKEELDGQLAVVKYTLKTLEELETEAISIEARLQKVPSSNNVDMKSLAATLTGNRTKLVTLHTQAEAQRARIERYMMERHKRINEIKKYQTLLIDLEQWLGEAQATISTEIRLTSVKIVRDQIRASESLEQDLRVRSTQLEHLLKEVQQLVGFVDVQPLVQDMTSNLGSLHCVIEEAQQCLEHRLKNLQVRCT
eukprot:GFUD01009873.1.p1 GENE.GFUD01009873.1~~GFUD01009873.1.p1  ORF type:complete len:2234 (-),score=822.51 GFUD01009873.1:392-6148(-)